MLSLRRLVLLVLLAGVLFLIALLLHTTLPFYYKPRFASFDRPDSNDLDLALTTDSKNQTFTETEQLLGIASKVYVLSLPARRDRRENMDFLSKSLSVHAGESWKWTYVEAVNKDDPVVKSIMNAVRRLRNEYSSSDPGGGSITTKHAAALGSSSNTSTFRFVWPEETPSTSQELEQRMRDLLPSPFLPPKEPPLSLALPEPMVCATQNNTIAPYTPTLPHHRILTPARIACWHSHVSLMHMIANDDVLGDEDTIIVLEDDVDAERDIGTRLREVWGSLPKGWDIVYLGHCWSNEASHPALEAPQAATTANGTMPPSPTNRTRTRLHPSSSPLCTHAYALSRSGARRILIHLRYPPFAYSRSIDKALAWLIESGRIKSFSVVPSVVIQRKDAKSDVMPGKGSIWKDVLDNGVFG